jgi:hypothetical protein
MITLFLGLISMFIPAVRNIETDRKAAQSAALEEPQEAATLLVTGD